MQLVCCVGMNVWVRPITAALVMIKFPEKDRRVFVKRRIHVTDDRAPESSLTVRHLEHQTKLIFPVKLLDQCDECHGPVPCDLKVTFCMLHEHHIYFTLSNAPVSLTNACSELLPAFNLPPYTIPCSRNSHKIVMFVSDRIRLTRWIILLTF